MFPFVTAGDMVNMVGYKDESFPAPGWHIDSEMGGFRDHPIKLRGRFSAKINLTG
jgi:hypothetical protein